MFSETEREAYAVARKIVAIGPEHAGFELAQTVLEKLAEASRTGRESRSFAPFVLLSAYENEFPELEEIA